MFLSLWTMILGNSNARGIQSKNHDSSLSKYTYRYT
jgi:hypothetical protein